MWLYGKIANFRNALYEKGALKSFPLGARTISVGNITAGGTGKTPLVAFVAEVLAEKDENVCILTRGYGRENSRRRVLVSDREKILTDVRTAGDEPFELAQKLLGKAIVVADADRVAAASWALEKFDISVFVLDDAFQHRRAKRDLDIVAIDATNPFGGGKNFLREPLENLKRADAIVITRANLIEDIEDLRSQISEYNSVCPIFTAKNKISDLRKIEDFHAKAVAPALAGALAEGPKILAFCALGNPDNFFDQLKQDGFNLISTKKFPDHHFYIQKDIEALEKKARQTGAEVFIATAKDTVKLKDLVFNRPCYVATSEMIFDDEKKLRDLISAVSNSKSQI